MDKKMRISTILMVVITTIFLLMAAEARAYGEVYRWVDENGKVHYGDHPPQKADAKTVDIEIPPASGVEPLPDSPYAVDEADKNEPSYAEQQRTKREEKRKSAMKSKAELEDACAQRREVISQLEPSPRVMIRTEDGEVQRMDDGVRLKSLTEAKDFLAKNCKD